MPQTEAYTWLQDVHDEVEMPKEGILSRPLVKSEGLQVTMFAMAAGEEMAEHTTSMEAIVHFLSGEAEVTFAGERRTASAGSWLRMEPRLPHSINAKTPVRFQLILLRNR